MNARWLLPLTTISALSCRPAADHRQPQQAPSDQDTGDLALLPGPTVVSNDLADGILLRTDERDAHLELRAPDGDWTAAPGVPGAGLDPARWYWLPQDLLPASPDTVEIRIAAGDAHSTPVTATPLDADLDVGTPTLPLVASDSLTATIQGPSMLTGQPGSLGLHVALREPHADVEGWLTEACTDTPLDTCLSIDPAGWQVDDLSQPLTLQAFAPAHADAAVIDLDAVVWVSARATDGSDTLGTAAVVMSDPLPSTGRDTYWGDLHAHSNLSYDGCEDGDDACGPRAGCGAGDFFDQAAAAGLDFVALTDHAEWGRYYPQGLDGDSVDIWEEQQRLVALADDADGGPLPLLGYEWTNWRERPVDTSTDYEGGHKTVLFGELSVPADFRIGAGRVSDTLVKGDGVYTRSEGPQTPDPRELVDLLDDAAATHGEVPIISFFHHPAVEAPQGVDFGNHDNAPDDRYETLVEIYSEHGASECIDLTAADCDWEINHGAVTYLPRGSAQYALKMGYHLGFTAGTDSHDALPGSIDDGPGLHATAGEGYPEPSEQFAPGGLTGALISGDLTRRHLFSALAARATAATSGPRPDLRVVAIDVDGRAWLPGSVGVTAGSPLRLLASITADGYTVDHISIIDQTGATLSRTEGGQLDAEVTLAAGGACYLPVVLSDGIDDHRVWVSPFFSST